MSSGAPRARTRRVAYHDVPMRAWRPHEHRMAHRLHRVLALAAFAELLVLGAAVTLVALVQTHRGMPGLVPWTALANAAALVARLATLAAFAAGRSTPVQCLNGARPQTGPVRAVAAREPAFAAWFLLARVHAGLVAPAAAIADAALLAAGTAGAWQAASIAVALAAGTEAHFVPHAAYHRGVQRNAKRTFLRHLRP